VKPALNHRRLRPGMLTMLAYTGVLLGTAAAAVVLPWQFLVWAAPYGALIAWGLLDARVAVVVMTGTAYFVQSESVVKSHYLRMTVGLFSNPIQIDLPAFYFGVVLLYVTWYGLSALATPEGRRWRTNRYMAPLLGLLAYALVTLAWAPNMNWSLLWQVYFAANMLTFWLVFRTADNYLTLRQIVHWLVVVCALNALVAVAFLFITPIETKVQLTPDISYYLLTGGGGLSASHWYAKGMFGHRSLLAEYHVAPTIMSIALALALGLLVSRRHGWSRRLVLLCSAMLFFSLSVTSDVRAPTIGLIVMIGYLLLCVDRFRAHRLFYGGLAALLFVGILSTDFYVRRVVSGSRQYPRILSVMPWLSSETRGPKNEFTLGSGGTIRSGARSELFSDATRRFVESYGLGGGIDNGRYTGADRIGSYVHNVTLSVLQDFGVPGLAFAAWLGWILVRSFLRLMRAPPSEPKEFALTVVGAGAAVLGASIADFVYNDGFLWPTLGLCAAAMECGVRTVGQAGPAASLGAPGSQ